MNEITWPIEKILYFTRFLIKKNGFISTKKAGSEGISSTSDVVKQALTGRYENHSHEFRNMLYEFDCSTGAERKEYSQAVKEVLDWARLLDSKSEADLYLRKLGATAQKEKCF